MLYVLVNVAPVFGDEKKLTQRTDAGTPVYVRGWGSPSERVGCKNRIDGRSQLTISDPYRARGEHATVSTSRQGPPAILTKA
jgi:hypothetical protein